MVKIVKNAIEKIEEIIDAGFQLFLTKGYENTTIQHAMKKVQIAKRTTLSGLIEAQLKAPAGSFGFLLEILT
jgi:hypothetical protein